MKFRQVFLIVSTHVAWQVYTAVAIIRGNSLLLMSFGLVIGAFTYIAYLNELKEDKPNEENEA